jgi:hypothetical protein
LEEALDRGYSRTFGADPLMADADTLSAALAAGPASSGSTAPGATGGYVLEAPPTVAPAYSQPLTGFQPSVIAAFPQYSAPLEGRLNRMYLDNRGLVTTGVGCLINSVADAQQLPWKVASGAPATAAQVAAAWNLVKGGVVSATKTWWNTIAGTTPVALHLEWADVDALTQARAGAFVKTLIANFPNILTWPADAQLGILSVAWGCGPNLQTVSWMSPFVACVRTDDFAGMAASATWSNINANRKVAQQLLFQNAAAVVQQGLDRSVLHWPNSTASAPAVSGEYSGRLAPAHCPHCRSLRGYYRRSGRCVDCHWLPTRFGDDPDMTSTVVDDINAATNKINAATGVLMDVMNPLHLITTSGPALLQPSSTHVDNPVVAEVTDPLGLTKSEESLTNPWVKFGFAVVCVGAVGYGLSWVSALTPHRAEKRGY